MTTAVFASTSALGRGLVVLTVVVAVLGRHGIEQKSGMMTLDSFDGVDLGAA